MRSGLTCFAQAMLEGGLQLRVAEEEAGGGTATCAAVAGAGPRVGELWGATGTHMDICK